MKPTFPSTLLRVLLRLYPASFRRARGPEMERLYRQMWSEIPSPGPLSRMGFRLRLATDLMGNALSVWRQKVEDTGRSQAHDSRGDSSSSAKRMRGSKGDPGRPGAPSGVASELRFALRRLTRSPGFTAVAVLTLALGVAANTSMFALINGIYLKPLPFPQPEELTYLQEANSRMLLGTSYDAYSFFKERSISFQALAAHTNSSITLEEGEDPVRLNAAMVSANFFDVLGVAPIMGRGFLPEEEGVGSEAVVVLGYGTWKNTFGRDPAIIGKPLRFSTGIHTVVGVMPEGFRFPRQNVQGWVSLRRLSREPGRRALTMVGRLNEGTSLEPAGEEVMRVGQILGEEFPSAKGGEFTHIYPLQDYVVGSSYEATFSALFMAVGFLFLIACANLTNLLMARANSRARELAVRQALGASRLRMALTSISEPLLLSLASSLVGILGAHWAIGLLVSAGPSDIPRQAEIGIDLIVVLFALIISLLAGLSIGLASQPRSGVRKSPGDLLSGSRISKGKTLQGSFTVVQVALTFALLAGVGLMSKTVRNLQLVDLGFEAEGALVVDMALSRTRYPESRDRVAFLDQVMERIQALPGITSAGYSTTLPLDGGWNDQLIRVEGDVSPNEELPTIEYDAITPGFLPAMGISLVQGRLLDRQDGEGTLPVVVINETAARLLFSEGQALGKRFSGPEPTGTDWVTVVGVVEDVRHHDLTTAATPKYYQPIAHFPWDLTWIPELVVRLQGRNLEESVGLFRSMIRELDGGNPLVTISPLQNRVDRLLEGPRLNAFVLAGFTLAALSLAALGLYAVIAFGVAERRKEIGLRMALGAGKGRVRVETLRRGLRLTLLGILAGIPLALGLGRVMASLLFGVGSYDPPVLAQVTVVLTVVSALACFIPSAKASRVDPMESLRQD
jgi:putative ABC transport system permease protein